MNGKKFKLILILLCVLIIAVIIFIILGADHKQITHKEMQSDKKQTDISDSGEEETALEIVGTWVYSDGTKYRFDADMKGGMYVGNYEYKYEYSLVGNFLEIDYKDAEVHDSVYEFGFEGDKLRLTGKEGTAGGTYLLERAEN